MISVVAIRSRRPVSAGRGGSGTRTVIRRFTGVVGTLVVALRVGAARWARSARSRVVERLSRVVSGGSGTSRRLGRPAPASPTVRPRGW